MVTSSMAASRWLEISERERERGIEKTLRKREREKHLEQHYITCILVSISIINKILQLKKTNKDTV